MVVKIRSGSNGGGDLIGMSDTEEREEEKKSKNEDEKNVGQVRSTFMFTEEGG